MMQALHTSLAGGKTLLSDAEADAVRQSFGARAEAKQKAAAAEAAIRNAAEGERFLAENKSLKGVFTTPSGLKYMVLRSEEHTSALQSLMRISYAVFCWKKNKGNNKRDNRLSKCIESCNL